MTRAEMDTQLGRMVVLKGMPGDSDPYWGALHDIPLGMLKAGVDHAIKTRAWFPVPAELRMDVDAAHHARPVAEHPTSYRVPLDGGLPVTIKNTFGGKDIELLVTEDLHRHCEQCEDSGMAKWWCGSSPSTRWPWMESRSCGRHGEHDAHDWAAPCACAATNPVILRRKESAAAKFAQPPEKVA